MIVIPLYWFEVKAGDIMKPFEGILGNNAELRTIEFLLPFKKAEFNISTMSREVGISRPTIIRVVKQLLEWDILKTSRKEGNTNYYQLNRDSPFIDLFNHFNNVIIAHMLSPEDLDEIHIELSKFGIPGPKTKTQGVPPPKQKRECDREVETPWKAHKPIRDFPDFITKKDYTGVMYFGSDQNAAN